MRKMLIILLSVVLLVSVAESRKVNLKLKDPAKTASAMRQKSEAKSNHEINRDSTYLAHYLPFISISGYDKSVNSASESFFLTNRSDETLREIEIEITYKALDGRMIHKATYRLDCVVPGGETRQLEVKTFDKQKTFYYAKSNPPRKRATPFEVEIKVLGLDFFICKS